MYIPCIVCEYLNKSYEFVDKACPKCSTIITGPLLVDIEATFHFDIEEFSKEMIPQGSVTNDQINLSIGFGLDYVHEYIMKCIMNVLTNDQKSYDTTLYKDIKFLDLVSVYKFVLEYYAKSKDELIKFFEDRIKSEFTNITLAMNLLKNGPQPYDDDKYKCPAEYLLKLLHMDELYTCTENEPGYYDNVNVFIMTKEDPEEIYAARINDSKLIFKYCMMESKYWSGRFGNYYKNSLYTKTPSKDELIYDDNTYKTFRKLATVMNIFDNNSLQQCHKVIESFIDKDISDIFTKNITV